MKIQDIVLSVKRSCEVAIMHGELYQEGREYRSFDYWLGYLMGVSSAMSDMLWHAEDIDEYKIKSFEDEKEAEFYSYDVDWVATEFDAAVNNSVYKQMNPDLEEVIVGKTYHSHITPYGYFLLDGNVIPVYSDDAGQCDYIRIDEESYSGGTYNFYPEQEFISRILHNKIDKAVKQLKVLYKEKGE